VIVDDVCTTGASTIEAIKAAKEAGMEVVAVVCLVEREESGGRAAVEAAASDPILRVIDPAKLQAVASVPASDVPRVIVGRPGHVVGPGGTVEENVTVLTRPGQLDQTGSVGEVRLAFTGPTRLTAGTPVQISIVAESHPKAVLIETAAVQHEGDEAFVMIVKDDKKAHRQVVTLGLTDGEHIEVLSGVAAGDRVIVKGQNGLPDGADVTIAP